MWPLSLYWIHRSSDAPAGAMFANGARAIAIYGTGCVVSAAATLGIPHDLPFVRVLVGAAALLGWMALVALLWRTYRRELLSLLSVRTLLRRQKRAATAEEFTLHENETERDESLGAAHAAEPGDVPEPPANRPGGNHRP